MREFLYLGGWAALIAVGLALCPTLLIVGYVALFVGDWLGERYG